jgi:hypothetical protein
MLRRNKTQYKPLYISFKKRINICMSTSREYAKFKRTFVGPTLTRKQRIALMPPMPAENPFYNSKYKLKPVNELSLEDKKKALWSAYVVERRKNRDKSMPQWADKKAIQSIYIRARQLTKETGIKYEVDHIIPSNHPLVCGLHVESNLQIITESENIKKSNSFLID